MLQRFASRLVARVVGALLLVAIGAALTFWVMRPRLTDEVLRETVYATIQREAPASFYVTGSLDIMATTTVSNTRYLFPDVLGLDLGTTQATVRMPGRVSYGFDVRLLRPEMIDVRDDGVIQVTLPELAIYSVEPYLSRMEVQTSVGWARTHAGSGRTTEHRAIRVVEEALRTQGAAYVQEAAQARIHTAEALRLLLIPVLEAVGLDAPRLRFQIGPEIVMEPQG